MLLVRCDCDLLANQLCTYNWITIRVSRVIRVSIFVIGAVSHMIVSFGNCSLETTAKVVDSGDTQCLLL